MTAKKVMAAHSKRTLAQAKKLGFDLVQVTIHNCECDACLPYQGRVYSLSGKDKVFPKLPKSPPFCSTCKHVILNVSADHLKRLGQYDALERLAALPDFHIHNQTEFDAFRARR